MLYHIQLVGTMQRSIAGVFSCAEGRPNGRSRYFAVGFDSLDLPNLSEECGIH